MRKRTLIAVLLTAGFLAAQQPTKPPAQQPATSPDQPGDDIFRVAIRTRFVIAPVTVTDRNGDVVDNLNTTDFQLFDNKKLQKITEDQATHPISLVVAVEAGSQVEKIIPQVAKIGTLMSNLLVGDNGEAAVLSFDHRVQTLTGFTSDPDMINAAMKKLKSGSTTFRLNDAAMQGINMLKNRPSTRKRILLIIGENRDYGSELHVRDVLTAAEFANVVVYSVNMSHLLASMTSTAQPPRPNPIPAEARHMPDGSIGTPTTDSQNQMGDWTPAIKEVFLAAKSIFIPNPLEVYTKYTGGREFSFMTQKTLERAIADIGRELHGEYLLTYSPSDLTEAGFHEIEVRVLKPGYKVRTRSGYWLAQVNDQ